MKEGNQESLISKEVFVALENMYVEVAMTRLGTCPHASWIHDEDTKVVAVHQRHTLTKMDDNLKI